MPHAVSQEQTPITQPFYAARLSDNALAKKARFVWTPYHESVDATGNFSLSHASSARFAVDKWTARSYTQSGFSNTGSTITRISPYSVPSATAFTIYILGQLGSNSSDGALWGTGGNNYISVTTAGAFKLFISSGARVTSSNVISAGESFELLAYGNNGSYNILLNGTLTSAGGTFNTLIDPTFLAFGASFRSLTCRMYVAAYWPEILNDAQQVELRRNPWQLFEPEPIQIYWSAAAGANNGSGTVSGTGALEGTGYNLHYGDGDVTATGTLAGTGYNLHYGNGSVSGTGTLAGEGYAPTGTSEGAGTVSGTGTFVGEGYALSSGTGDVTGEGTLVGAGTDTQLVGKSRRRGRRPIWELEGSKKKCLRRRCGKSRHTLPPLWQSAQPTIYGKSSKYCARLWN